MTGRACDPRWELDAQQAVHDASLHLQVVRARCREEIATRGALTRGEVVSGGIAEMRDGLAELLRSASELLAVTAYAGPIEVFARTHRNNRAVVQRGVRMVSLFHADGLEPAVRDLVSDAADMPYFLAFGPMQIKIVDRRTVVAEGPEIDGDRSLLLMQSPEAVAAGLQYFGAVRSTAVRAAADLRATVPGVDTRQGAVAGMLGAGLHDEEIAATLEVSVRTVRTDVARLMSTLGTRTRFATGVEYARANASKG